MGSTPFCNVMLIAISIPAYHLQVSFVNSICTVKGGTHVNYIVDQITKCVNKRLPALTGPT